MDRDPLEQLESSHRRQDEAMRDLVDGCDAGDADRIADVLAFLDRAVPRHFADEEASLFPRLVARVPAWTAQLERLTAAHREHEALIARLRASLDAGDLAALPAVARELERLYVAHVAEEDELFVQVPAVLPPEELAALGAEMQGRRGRGGGGGGGRGR